MTYVADIIFKDFKHESNFGLDYSFVLIVRILFSKVPKSIFICSGASPYSAFYALFLWKISEYDSQC